ncbi:MAG: hypothetical protein INR73_23315 [Williamsia sp.]|nr:hypothetical protein [Williamsia sp.]
MKKGFFHRNGLSIVFAVLFLFSIAAQIATGWKEHNEELQEYKQPPLSLSGYFRSGHFIEATFENWESEFLQMGLFVVLTIFLRQRGSSESKGDEPEDVDREPDPFAKDAPWPVKQGGLVLAIYKHSLSIALFSLFLISFVLHWIGSWKDYNLEQRLKGLPTETSLHYLGNTKFWFESFQNWQSEFLSVWAIILFSVYLRQKGSSQSKPVDAPDEQTGD